MAPATTATTLVLGAGVSGRAVARLLAASGTGFTIHDERVVGIVEGTEVRTGPWDDALLAGITEVVASPGIPEWAPPIRAALERGIPVRSELDLAAERITGTVAAVTGTNGKTTTTELIEAMLRAGGRSALAAGNIGLALSEVAVAPTQPDTVVVEASSFQLRFADRFRPDVAVLLNIAPDHLDWHRTPEAYRDAKARLVEHQRPADTVVYNADDPLVAGIVATAVARPVPISGTRLPDGGWGVDGDLLVVGDARVPLGDLHVADAAYRTDLVAAGAAADALGVGAAAIESVWRGFRPGEHRRSVVGVFDGVTWVNDSKATNPHAAVAAIAAHPSVILIAGGRNKGLDLAPVLAVAGLRHVFAIGEAAAELVTLAPHLVTDVGDIDEAVRRSAELAVPGDTVLLAPACASFDQFDSYGDRGDQFTAAVRRQRGTVQ